MTYSIHTMLHNHTDKQGKHKLLIKVTCNRQHYYCPLPVKLTADQLHQGSVINHPHKTKINALIRVKIAELEGAMLDLMKLEQVSPEDIKRVVGGQRSARDKFTDFITSYIDEVKGGKKADATIQVYQSILDELITYDAHLYFHKINLTWLNRYEQYQRTLWEHNTVHKKMKNIKGMLRRAAEKGLIKPDRFTAYKVPTYEQQIPAYLDEQEIIQFKAVCDAIQKPMMKMSGYYFLLSCYAGYRISDFKKFSYESMVTGRRIRLRTKKNKRVVSILIHSRLSEILSFCREHPFDISEQNMRDYVKEIARMAGVDRKIKVHTARHSFAMLLMDKGFDLEEVAELLGVTLKTASVYARISNKRLEHKILEKLG